MARGIIIPAVTFLPLEEREFDGLQHYQDAVGGFIEPIPIADPALTLYVNEEGKSRKMSFNERATVLWWLLVPQSRGRDLIVGDCVLSPDEPDSGSELLRLLPLEQVFRVEVQLLGSGNVWAAGDRSFDTWFEAAKFALVLQDRFDFVSGARVTAA